MMEKVVESGPPYDRKSAVIWRRLGKAIVACFWCLSERRQKPYWPKAKCVFVREKLVCPEHQVLLEGPMDAGATWE